MIINIHNKEEAEDVKDVGSLPDLAPASSAQIKAKKLTTKIQICYGASSMMMEKSALVDRLEIVPSTNASWLSPSNAPGTSHCSPSLAKSCVNRKIKTHRGRRTGDVRSPDLRSRREQHDQKRKTKSCLQKTHRSPRA